jgi:antitoxin ParD1/3/4
MPLTCCGSFQVTRNTSISLDDHFADFIDEQMQSGQYGSASDVVRAGLRLLEDHEARAKALQDALVAGEESGEPRSFDSEAFLAQMRSKHPS